MKITECNLTEYKLTDGEINELIRLTKNQMHKNSNNKAVEMFYGLIVGKLIIMKNE